MFMTNERNVTEVKKFQIAEITDNYNETNFKKGRKTGITICFFFQLQRILFMILN